MLIEYPLERISAEELHRIALKSKGEIARLFLHWTAGHYDNRYDDYHVNISFDGNVYLTCEELTDEKCHTIMHNSRCVGIALDCAVGAVLQKALYPGKVNWGEAPPTTEQLKALCKVVAVLTDALGLEITNTTVTTHAEIANEDGYGPTNCGHSQEMRWDLWLLPNPKNSKELVMGGSLIRDSAKWYREHYFTKIFN